jgi:hypothetical protein
MAMVGGGGGGPEEARGVLGHLLGGWKWLAQRRGKARVGDKLYLPIKLTPKLLYGRGL